MQRVEGVVIDHAQTELRLDLAVRRLCFRGLSIGLALNQFRPRLIDQRRAG